MNQEFIAAARIADFKDSPMQVAEVNGRDILVTKVGNEYFATSNRCPHMGSNFSYGTLEGTVVRCYAHGRRFDVRDGSAQGHGLGRLLGGHGLTTYEVRIEGDEIMVSTTPRRAGAS